MTGVLLQVRLDSSRLPNKALFEIFDLSVIEHAMKALKKVNVDKHILVTTEDSLHDLAPLAKKFDFEIFCGSKNNVLERYVDAIKKYNLKQIIRATGDNPLVSYELANILIDLHNTNNHDYSGYLNNPVGTGVEVVESRVLIQALNESTKQYDLEHVTPYIYNNKDKFSVFQGDAPLKYLLKDTFVTIDTQDDYNRIVKLFHELYHNEIISLESVIQWLKKEQ
ncbi:MAG: acylneuraminate cytidylyltransferase [Spirochaetaceae bacterium]